jgi:phosphatidylethanolamine/phosphatidyl-N-methylethanolamine N-methyltransferase
MPWLTFMKEVIRDNKTTGAFGPSSRELAEAVTDLAQLKDAKVIVEYGSGDGVFTEAVLRKISSDAYFIAMEVSPTLVEATKKRCPTANVIHDGAQNALKYLKEAGHEQCDAIVSGLPWTRFDDNLQNEILEATYNVLAPGGRFVTFAYAMSPIFPSGRRFFHDKLPKRFPGTRRVGPIWKNLPPCHVYIAEKKG